MKTPLQAYQYDLATPGFMADPEQAQAIEKLNILFKHIMQRYSWRRYLPAKPILGIYLYGPVGTGKTYLMDTFYDCLPGAIKKRMHFHEFMRWVQQELKNHQGEKDPLVWVARLFSRQIKIICFDEFIVEDIADAMLLGRLLQALFDLKVIVVATSNTPIADLYKEGLQRQNFLPTIQLLQRQLQEIKVDNQQDYRRRELTHLQVYFTPINEVTRQQLQQVFQGYSQTEVLHGNKLMIAGRDIHAVHRADTVIWFTFAELCCTQRSADDYLALAQQFSVILVSEIPVLTDKDRDAVKRFINFIDIGYDKRIRVIISAAVAADQLYDGKRLADVFRRTKSRLQEMQSQEYLDQTIYQFTVKGEG